MSEHTIPDIGPLLKRLSLANSRRTYRELIRRAERESWTYGQFLQTVASEEIAHRRQTRVNRLTHRAGFPFLKTIEEFDFSFQSTLRLNLLGSVLSPDFITDGRTLILIGKPGRGKTHLAVATAYRHIQSGFEALFVTAAKMIDHLSGAAAQGRLSDVLSRYTHPALLVVDELGYLSYGSDAANMLFHVVNDRYLSGRSMIFTTNKKLTDWGAVLHDHDLAAAIVDRLLERGRIIALDGPSMRSQHLALDDQIDSQKTATMLRGGMLPQAYAYPNEKRATYFVDGSTSCITDRSFLRICRTRILSAISVRTKSASVMRAIGKESPSGLLIPW